MAQPGPDHADLFRQQALPPYPRPRHHSHRLATHHNCRPPFLPPQPPPRAAIRGAPRRQAPSFHPLPLLTPCLYFSSHRADADCRTLVHRELPPRAPPHIGEPLRSFHLQPQQPLQPLTTAPPHSTRAATDSLLQPLLGRVNHTPSMAPLSISSPTALTQQMTPTLACRRLFPTANPLHCGQASPLSFFLPASQKLVHHPTALLPRPSPLHLITGTAGIRSGCRRPAPWEQAPLPLGLEPNGQVGREPLAGLAWLAP
jgi:hypothetical protein